MLEYPRRNSLLWNILDFLSDALYTFQGFQKLFKSYSKITDRRVKDSKNILSYSKP